MLDVLIDSLLDSLKVLAFVFVIHEARRVRGRAQGRISPFRQGYGKNFTIDFLGNVVEGKSINHLNVTMVAFSESARLFDSLTRDETTLIRSDAKNLSFLNMDFILHPQRDIDLAIYPTIQRDMKFPQKK